MVSCKLKKSVFSFLFFLNACSLNADYATQRLMKDAVRSEKFSQAVALAKSEDFYSGDASRMIKYVDLGTAHYLNGEYYQALQNFDKAQALAKEQYTKSISKTIAGFIGGDAMTEYEAPAYELSLLRFYISLTHYRLYQTGKYEAYEVEDPSLPEGKKVVSEKQLTPSEKRKHLNASRATVLEWVSFLQEHFSETAGKRTFKRDMLAKTWGGFVHNVYGKTGDRQIAKQLYRDVDKILLQNYNLYSVYNEKHEKYADDYDDLPEIGEKKVREDYVSATDKAKTLLRFAKESEKNLSSKKKDNLHIVLKTGLVVSKEEETVSFVVPWEILLFGHADDHDFRNFITLALAGEKIEFKIPAVKKPVLPDGYEISFKKENAQKDFLKKQAALVEPVSEIVYYEFEQKRAGMIAQKGAFTGAKYAAALWSAYALWDKEDSFKQIMAVAAFKGAAASIRSSDSVDLRHWSLLPDNIWQQSFYLPEGTYIMTVLRKNTPVHTQKVDIKGENIVSLDINLVSE